MWEEYEESVKPEEEGAAPLLACLFSGGWLGWQQPGLHQGLRALLGWAQARAAAELSFHSYLPLSL